MKITSLIFALTVVVSSVTFTFASEQEKLLDELVNVLERNLKSKAGAVIKNRKNRPWRKLACPRAPKSGPIPVRSEKKCRRHRQCGEGERCCDWADSKHCLKGIDRRRRSGTCPKITHFNDFCISNLTPCRYDNECPGEDEKCCLNPGCGYKECLSIRQNLACPVPKSNLPTNRTEAICSKDIECGVNEKCCEWFETKHCLPGISTIPTPGVCPYTPRDNTAVCSDEPQCEYDAECGGINDKCCLNLDCDRSECVDMNKNFHCPDIELELTTQTSECSPQSNPCAGFGKVCCAAGVDAAGDSVYQCVEGEYKQPKKGQCPPASQLVVSECEQDFEGGCQFDADCFGDHKCCETSCGYKDCVQLRKEDNQNLLKRFLETVMEES